MSNPQLERKRKLKNVNVPLLTILMDAVHMAKGDFVEMGVYKGYAFKAIYGRANRQGRKAWGIDTFSGMPTSPVESDNERYPPGEVNIGGTGLFKSMFPDAICVEGLIPDVLADLDIPQIAFCHLDIDHYFSTRPALDWIWERLTVTGIVCIHDFGLYHREHASLAVHEWSEKNNLDYVGTTDNTVFFQKGVS